MTGVGSSCLRPKKFQLNQKTVLRGAVRGFANEDSAAAELPPVAQQSLPAHCSPASMASMCNLHFRFAWYSSDTAISVWKGSLPRFRIERNRPLLLGYR